MSRLTGLLVSALARLRIRLKIELFLSGIRGDMGLADDSFRVRFVLKSGSSVEEFYRPALCLPSSP